MRRFLRSTSLTTLLAVAALALCGLAVSGTTACGGHNAAEGQPADTRIYECPMACVKPGESHPYTHVGPGECPVCGMNLVPSATQPTKQH